MTIVVDDGHPARFSTRLISPLRALEPGQRRHDAVERNADLQAHGDGGKCIEDVVASRDRQLEAAFAGTVRYPTDAIAHMTAAASPVGLDGISAHVRVLAGAVRDD